MNFLILFVVVPWRLSFCFSFNLVGQKRIQNVYVNTRSKMSLNIRFYCLRQAGFVNKKENFGKFQIKQICRYLYIDAIRVVRSVGNKHSLFCRLLKVDYNKQQCELIIADVEAATPDDSRHYINCAVSRHAQFIKWVDFSVKKWKIN